MRPSKAVIAAVKRNDRVNAETAATLRDIATSLRTMADGLEQDDDILGVLASTALISNLPALPAHVREAFTEWLSDEAAQGLRADIAYYSAEAGVVTAPEHPPDAEAT